MATNEQNKQAPVTQQGAQNLGGKVETNKSDGGTMTDADKFMLSQIREKQGKGQTLTAEESKFLQDHDPNRVQTGADKPASPTQEQSDKAASGVVTSTDEKDGVKTVRSGVDQEALDKAKENEGNIPQAVTETQRLTGVPGQLNLTQSGKLSGDKSVRDDRSLEDINKELEDKAGPNPTPNRDGNERLKAELGFSPDVMLRIDRDTSFMAEDLKKIREESNLSEEHKRKLEDMEKQLQGTGRNA